MKKRQGWGRWAVNLLACSSACLGLFFARRGWERPLLGVADSFCISGFFTLIFSLFPYFARGETFDGFVYAARSALSGIFPHFTESYSSFKDRRSARREEKNELKGAKKDVKSGKNERDDGVKFTQNSLAAAWVGGSFLAVGLFFCLFA